MGNTTTEITSLHHFCCGLQLNGYSWLKYRVWKYVCTQTHGTHKHTHTHTQIAGHLSGLSTWPWRGEMSPQPYQDKSSCVHPGPTSHTLTGWKHPQLQGRPRLFAHCTGLCDTVHASCCCQHEPPPTHTHTPRFLSLFLSFFSHPLRCVLFNQFLQISQHSKNIFWKNRRLIFCQVESADTR